MASTLDGGGRDRNVTRGHGTSALGPGDTSDTGSDITGGPGLIEGDVIGLDETGSTSDAEVSRDGGAFIGDAELDGDSDSGGSGERRAAGLDPADRADADRDTDRIIGPTDALSGLTGSSTGLESDAGAGTTDSGRDQPAEGSSATGGTPV